MVRFRPIHSGSTDGAIPALHEFQEAFQLLSSKSLTELYHHFSSHANGWIHHASVYTSKKNRNTQATYTVSRPMGPT